MRRRATNSTPSKPRRKAYGNSKRKYTKTSKSADSKSKYIRSRSSSGIRSSSSPTKPFTSALARMIFPQTNHAAVRFPDGTNAKTVAMNVVTTGRFAVPVTTGANVTGGTVGAKGGATALVFFPGSLYKNHAVCTNRMKLHNNAALDNDGSPEIDNTFTDNLDNTKSGGTFIDEIHGQYRSYRITAATIKLQYVGSSDDNEGELIVHKFDPSSTDADNAATIPLKPDAHTTCRVYKRAKDGCYITCSRSHISAGLGYKQTLKTDQVASGYVQEAQASMECVVLFLANCKNASNANASTGLPDTPFRFEMVQTVELIPKNGAISNRLADECHPEIPLLLPAYNQLMHDLALKDLDIVDADKERSVQSLAQIQSASSTKDISGKTGLNVPKQSFEAGKPPPSSSSTSSSTPLHVFNTDNQFWNMDTWFRMANDVYAGSTSWNLVKGVMSYIDNHGMVMLHYDHCGPGNIPSDIQQDNLVNELCRLHDIDYGTIGPNAYYYFNWADDKFLASLVEHNLHTTDPMGQVAYTFFSAKKNFAPTLPI